MLAEFDTTTERYVTAGSLEQVADMEEGDNTPSPEQTTCATAAVSQGKKTALGQEKFWREPPTDPAYHEARRREIAEWSKAQLHRDISDLVYHKGGLQVLLLALEEDVFVDSHHLRQAVDFLDELIGQKWEDIAHLEETEDATSTDM